MWGWVGLKGSWDVVIELPPSGCGEGRGLMWKKAGLDMDNIQYTSVLTIYLYHPLTKHLYHPLTKHL